MRQFAAAVPPFYRIVKQPACQRPHALLAFNHGDRLEQCKTWQEHRGKWVALAQDEETVVAVGDSAKAVWDEARSKGYDKPILAYRPTELVGYIGGC